MYGIARYGQNQHVQAVLTYHPILIPLPIDGIYSYSIMQDEWGNSASIATGRADYSYPASIPTDSLTGTAQLLVQDTWGGGLSVPGCSDALPGALASEQSVPIRSEYSYPRPQDTWGVGTVVSAPAIPLRDPANGLAGYSHAVIREEFGGAVVVSVPDRDAFGAGKSTAASTDQFGG